VKVTVHWEVDEWSPAGGVAAEDEHPGSFTAGAMTLALFSAGKKVVLKPEGTGLIYYCRRKMELY